MICATLRLVWALVFALGFGVFGWIGSDFVFFVFVFDILVLLDYCGSPGAKWRVWRAVEFFCVLSLVFILGLFDLVGGRDMLNCITWFS